jgi:hypothetical protein
MTCYSSSMSSLLSLVFFFVFAALYFFLNRLCHQLNRLFFSVFLSFLADLYFFFLVSDPIDNVSP